MWVIAVTQVYITHQNQSSANIHTHTTTVGHYPSSTTIKRAIPRLQDIPLKRFHLASLVLEGIPPSPVPQILDTILRQPPSQRIIFHRRQCLYKVSCLALGHLSGTCSTFHFNPLGLTHGTVILYIHTHPPSPRRTTLICEFYLAKIRQQRLIQH